MIGLRLRIRVKPIALQVLLARGHILVILNDTDGQRRSTPSDGASEPAHSVSITRLRNPRSWNDVFVALRWGSRVSQDCHVAGRKWGSSFHFGSPCGVVGVGWQESIRRRGTCESEYVPRSRRRRNRY